MPATFTRSRISPDRIQRGQTRFRANQQLLKDRWDTLLRDHRGQWAAAFDGRIVTTDTAEALVQLIPESERGTAAVQLVTESENALLL